MSRHVEITYSPVPSRVGRVVELPDDEAAVLVREGRARYVGTGEPAAAPPEMGNPRPAPARAGRTAAPDTEAPKPPPAKAARPTTAADTTDAA